MKALLITVATTFLLTISYSQKLSQITLSGNSDIITLLTDDAVFVNLSIDEKLSIRE